MVFFVDTSYWLALELTDDQYHHRALGHWESLANSSFEIITTSYVFDETITFLNNGGHHEKAVEVGENILLSPTIELVHVDENLFFEGWVMFQKHKDKRYSLTDCISFIVMKQKDPAARGHPVDIARFDHLNGAETVAVCHLAAEEIRGCCETNMRMSQNVKRSTIYYLDRPKIVYKNKRADRAAFSKRQNTADLERPDACRAMWNDDDDLDHKLQPSR